VLIKKKSENINQYWKIIYLDEKDEEPTEGLNDYYGFYINRPFIMISRLNQERVIENFGGENLLLK